MNTTAAITITVEKIAPVTFGGTGYGNTYRFIETHSVHGTTYSSCERDVAYDFELAGLPVPAEFQGPYDCYGHKVEG